MIAGEISSTAAIADEMMPCECSFSPSHSLIFLYYLFSLCAFSIQGSAAIAVIAMLMKAIISVELNPSNLVSQKQNISGIMNS